MARRVNLSQLRSQLRQAESKRRQQIQKVNSAIREYNNKVTQYNASRRTAIDSYNRAVRSYNTRVRANQTRLRTALSQLGRQNVPASHSRLHRSTLSLANAYDRLDNSTVEPYFADLAENEAANSVQVLNSLLDETSGSDISGTDLNDSEIREGLSRISQDLDSRWQGALYALNADNPDAARHFCSSSREILTMILEIKAPNDDVFDRFPECDTTNQRTPTRRTKIRYCLDFYGITDDLLEEFIETNFADLNLLFNDLNAGTHGPAGKFTLSQLLSIKERVGHTIRFMCQFGNPDVGLTYRGIS